MPISGGCRSRRNVAISRGFTHLPLARHVDSGNQQ